jgi:stage IV sporulation protein FB
VSKVAPYILSGRIRQLTYRVHWTVLLAFPFGWVFSSSFTAGSLLAASLLLLIVAHEFGHFLVARFCGLHVVGFEFNILHGKCLLQTPEYEIELALVSWGGVTAQALLLFLFAPLYALGDVLPRPLVTLLAPMAAVFVALNALYIVVNLWPKAPLDGANAWKLIPYARSGDLRRFLKARALARKVSQRKVSGAHT